MNTRIGSFALAVCLMLLFCAPAFAGEPSGSALFGDYWRGFLDYWKEMFQKQNGVVMGVLGLGVVALFIITRGKWRK